MGAATAPRDRRSGSATRVRVACAVAGALNYDIRISDEHADLPRLRPIVACLD